MSTGFMRGRSRGFFQRALLLQILAFGCLSLPATAMAAGTGEQIDVVVDQAKLIKLPENIATLVVGNPLIADVTLQAGGMMVVTGKSYGATNIIAMDRQGTVLIDRVILVEGTTDKLVTVYRGVERASYSCTPDCQRRITLGDGATYFSAALDQAGSFSNQATGTATTAAANTAPAPRN
jgi:putative type II/III system pilus formation protein